MERNSLKFYLVQLLIWISLVLTVKLNTKYCTVFSRCKSCLLQETCPELPSQNYSSSSLLLPHHHYKPQVICVAACKAPAGAFFKSFHVSCSTALSRYYCQHPTGEEVVAPGPKWFLVWQHSSVLILMPASTSPPACELLCDPAGADSTLIPSQAQGPTHAWRSVNLCQIDLL